MMMAHHWQGTSCSPCRHHPNRRPSPSSPSSSCWAEPSASCAPDPPLRQLHSNSRRSHARRLPQTAPPVAQSVEKHRDAANPFAPRVIPCLSLSAEWPACPPPSPGQTARSTTLPTASMPDPAFPPLHRALTRISTAGGPLRHPRPRAVLASPCPERPWTWISRARRKSRPCHASAPHSPAASWPTETRSAPLARSTSSGGSREWGRRYWTASRPLLPSADAQPRAPLHHDQRARLSTALFVHLFTYT